jgi:hypothetical protein
MKKNLLIAVGIGLMLVGGGCRSLRPPGVSVREAIHRSELASTNRIVLPLTAESREFVLQFLRSGRNPVLEGDATISNPGAEQQYGGLLDLLGRGSLAVSNLVADQKFNASAAFKPWFPKPALRQVIDAREEFVLPVQPFAFLDARGDHWWVFYHRQKKLTHVLITRTSPTTMER